MDMIGICGDNCLYCPRYIATRKSSMTELQNVKEWWVRLELRGPDFPAQDMACSGCRPENLCAYNDIRACAQEKDFQNCGLCESYPCDLLQTAFEKTQALHKQAELVCTTEEMSVLKKAFFSKKQNLNLVYETIRKQKKR